VSKENRGTKRACGECGSTFFELNNDPIVCLSCGAVFVPRVVKAAPVTRRGPISQYRGK
jgi:uncharacterized protein (TIGR02300 family)